MLKKSVLFLFVIIMSLLVSPLTSFAINNKCTNNELNKGYLTEDILIKLLANPISKTINKRYYPQTEHILGIKRDIENNIMQLTVQVESFEGAHNPPYGLETITFDIPSTRVIKYVHKDIPVDSPVAPNKRPMYLLECNKLEYKLP